ncbi:hypothetical protein [Candidatus Lokiarchaeum ossiferum]|uniref:hypothetical protein n=1 Tax=Candidatus Lokiarchaeum ossiferum TaxID=2951803 RepID=UPI00352FD7AA
MGEVKSERRKAEFNNYESIRCNSCGSEEIHCGISDFICRSCGTCQNDLIVVKNHSFKKGDRLKINCLNFSLEQFPSIIGPFDLKNSFHLRLSRTHKKNTPIKNLEIFHFFRRLSAQYDISVNLVNLWILFLELISIETPARIFKNQNKLAAMVFFIYCHNANIIGIDQKQFFEYTTLTKKDFFKIMKIIRQNIPELYAQYRKHEKTNSLIYISYIKDKLKLDDEYVPAAKELLKIFQQILGTNARIRAAVAMVYSLKYYMIEPSRNHDKISLRKIAKSVNVTHGVLSKRINLLKKKHSQIIASKINTFSKLKDTNITRGPYFSKSFFPQKGFLPRFILPEKEQKKNINS